MFIFLFLVIYLILAIKRLEWAVLLLLALLPAYLIRFSLLGFPLTLLESMILIAFGVFVCGNFKDIWQRFMARVKHKKFDIHRSKVFRYPFAFELVLVLLVSYLAAGVANFSDAALGIWKAYFFEPLLVYILVFNVFNTQNAKKAEKSDQDNEPEKQQMRNMLSHIMKLITWPLAISAFLVSLIAILQRLGIVSSPENFWPRVTGPWPYPNALGLYLAPIVMLLIAWRVSLWQTSKNFWKEKSFWFSGVIIFVSVLSIYFARSEGALIGLTAGLFVFGLLANRLMRIITVALIVILGSFVMIYTPARTYALEKVMLKDLSGEIRKQQWRETLDMMKDNDRWLWGTGLSGYQTAIKPYHQEGIFFNSEGDHDFRRKIVIFDERYKAEHWQPVEIYMYPHNFFLNFWTELGLAGVLLFGWVLYRCLYWSFVIHRVQRNNNASDRFWLYANLGVLCAMIVVVVHGLVDVPYFKNDLAVLFWLLVAMLGIIKIEADKRIKIKK